MANNQAPKNTRQVISLAVLASLIGAAVAAKLLSNPISASSLLEATGVILLLAAVMSAPALVGTKLTNAKAYVHALALAGLPPLTKRLLLAAACAVFLSSMLK